MTELNQIWSRYSSSHKVAVLYVIYLAPFGNKTCGKASAERKTSLFLHFDPLSAILDFTEIDFHFKTPGYRGFTAHPPAKFQNNR